MHVFSSGVWPITPTFGFPKTESDGNAEAKESLERITWVSLTGSAVAEERNWVTWGDQRLCRVKSALRVWIFAYFPTTRRILQYLGQIRVFQRWAIRWTHRHWETFVPELVGQILEILCFPSSTECAGCTRRRDRVPVPPVGLWLRNSLRLPSGVNKWCDVEKGVKERKKKSFSLPLPSQCGCWLQ